MIPVVTIEQMQRIDKESINSDINVGFQYMDKAATGLFTAVESIINKQNYSDVLIPSHIVIVCGKGNNGGDGFLLAKYLSNANYQVECFSLCPEKDLKNEAQKAFQEYSKVSDAIKYIENEFDLEQLSNSLNSKVALVVDALLGTGIQGKPKGLYAKAIESINNAKKQNSKTKILSVDCPSGFYGDDGLIAEPCIEADITLTMGFPKLGSCFYPARKHTGILYIKDLEYPEEIVHKICSQSTNSNTYTPAMDFLRTSLPPRKTSGSKFDHGVAFMLCGSYGMTGAAILAANSAMRSGIGMVHLAAPKSIISALSANLQEVVLQPINETKSLRPALSSFNKCSQIIEKFPIKAACIGPGLSQEKETQALIKKIFNSLEIPLILDADGINAFKDSATELKAHKSELLITPHAGEWKRLFGEMPQDTISKIKTLKSKAKEFNMTILYKGFPTIVTDPEANCYMLPYGNSGMATAGSGDVLSGIITGLAAQGLDLTKAAILGAYLHGKAGDIASEKLTDYSMLASDISDNLSEAIKTLL